MRRKTTTPIQYNKRTSANNNGKRIREQEVNDMYILEQQMDYEDCLHNYDSDCGIYEEDNDDDNNYDEYNGIQDAEYYDNAGNYNYDNTNMDSKTK